VLARILQLVVLIEGELLLLGRGLRLYRSFLLYGVDLHQDLAGANVVAGMHKDAGKVSIHLGVDGSRAPRLNGRDVLIALRHRRRMYRQGLDRQCAHARAGSGLRRRLAAGSQREWGKREQEDPGS
jgi:hypothetical protein